MTVPTANVLVSTNKEALQDVLLKLASGKRINNLISEINAGDDLALFSNKANPHFISFRHSFNQSKPVINLEFLDPEGDFEYRFLSEKSVWDTLFNFIKSPGRGKILKNVIDKRAEYEGKRSRSELGDNVYADSVAKKLEKIVEDKSLYVAYGVGDNIKYWSNVHRTTLTGLTFDIQASRKFNLELAVVSQPLKKELRTGVRGQPADLDTLGLDFACEGYSQKFSLYEYYADGRNLYCPERWPVYAPVDYHLLISDVIKDYVKNATGANVIVMLPDLNLLIGKAAKKELLKDRGRYNTSSLKRIASMLKLEFVGYPNGNAEYVREKRVPAVLQAFADSIRFSSNPIPRLAAKAAVTDYFFKLSTERERGVPDALAPLDYLLNAINQNAEKVSINKAIVIESDQNIIDYWERAGANYSLNGYEPFNPEQPVIIVGDSVMINQVLYGQGKVTAPIHFTDDIFLSESYIDNINTIARGKDFSTSYVLGDLYKLPDEFAYADASLIQEAKDIQKKSQVPVFQYNTKNPNILSLRDTNEPGVYFSLLRTKFRSIAREITKTIGEGGIPSNIADFPIISKRGLHTALALSMEKSKGTVQSKQDIIQSIADRVSPEAMETTDLSGITQNMMSYLNELADVLDDQQRGFTAYMSDAFSRAPIDLITKFTEDLINSARILDIQTLPFFNITNGSYHNGPCLVFAQDAPVMGQVRPMRTAFNTYVTGAYKIVYFEHIISSGNVSSRFTLAKSAPINKLPGEETVSEQEQPQEGEQATKQNKPATNRTPGKPKRKKENHPEVVVQPVSDEFPASEEVLEIIIEDAPSEEFYEEVEAFFDALGDEFFDPNPPPPEEIALRSQWDLETQQDRDLIL